MNQYIHQHADWPAFRWDMASLAPELGAVRNHQGLFLGKMEALGFTLRAEAAVEALTEEVQKSSEIEGELLDRAQVRSSIARRLGIETGAPVTVDRNVDGVVEMILDATAGYDKPLTISRLFDWHAALFPSGRSGLRTIRVGAWRNDSAGLMQVVSGPIGRNRVHYEAPAASRLELEMARFVAWFEGPTAIDPVVRAAVAHFWFVTIHPFDDGNGRIGRAIADMALARSEMSPLRFYSMSGQIRKERKTYYHILESAGKGDMEITPWLTWFLGCLDRAIEGADTVLAHVLAKARFWQSNVDTALNERQRLLLAKLVDGFEGNLTSSKWAKIAKCSHDTALRDIHDLIEKGVLLPASAGGRSTRYLLRQV